MCGGKRKLSSILPLFPSWLIKKNVIEKPISVVRIACYVFPTNIF
jgi:hypothetical protein